MKKIIGLWAHPRSLSTAFERMMMQRGDFHVVHEPFNSLFDEGVVNLISPYGDKITLTTSDEIITSIVEWAEFHNIFIKDTFEHNYEGLLNRVDFLKKIQHTFIVREPEKTINSHYALNNNVTIKELGYQNLIDFMDHLKKNDIDVKAIVEADQLLADPITVVEEYCKSIDSEFIEEAMSWQASKRKEWERSEKWHVDAQHSNGFKKSSKKYDVRVDNSDKLKEFYSICLQQYREILKIKSQIDLTPVKS